MTIKEAWKNHPHYPNQVLLLGSHENFRRVSRWLVEIAAAMDDDDHVAFTELERVFSAWIGGMRSHERYEESKLYPYLECVYETKLDVLSEEHEGLHKAERGVRTALKEKDSGALHRALVEHDEVLNKHLDHEEDEVIPRLLDLTPAQFYEYAYGGPRPEAIPCCA